MNKLKPCPHCGRSHPFERHQDGSLYSIRCGCGASVEAGDPGDAEIIWNCRESDRMVELLRKQLADMDALNAKLNRSICDLAGRNEVLEEELSAHQESEFHPDWSQLQAAREALREHQAQLKKAERVVEAARGLLEVAEETYEYASDWHWKYGEGWKHGIEHAKNVLAEYTGTEPGKGEVTK